MYYAPDDDEVLNKRKRDLIAWIGEACRTAGLTYLLEPLVYHPTLRPGTEAYARAKPDMVRRATAAFADPALGADVLKVEVPVDLDFVEGFGNADVSRAEALEAFRAAAQPAAGRGLVYLSAGVPFDRFEASLELAVEAGVPFSGFMCGRAIWSDAIAVFGSGGEAALRQWLKGTGRDRLLRLIDIVT